MILKWTIRYLAVVVCRLVLAGNMKDAETGIRKELGGRLSMGAGILLKGEAGFEEKVERWQSWKMPQIAAVVEVKTEEDVQETVCLIVRFVLSSCQSDE
jgi:hypothetical protein